MTEADYQRVLRERAGVSYADELTAGTLRDLRRTIAAQDRTIALQQEAIDTLTRMNRAQADTIATAERALEAMRQRPGGHHGL